MGLQIERFNYAKVSLFSKMEAAKSIVEGQFIILIKISI